MPRDYVRSAQCHKFLDGYGALMVCAICGTSRTLPDHPYFDRRGYVLENSDELHVSKLKERAHRERLEECRRLEQLETDLESLQARRTP